MRIATSTMFAQQTASIDNLVVQQLKYGNELTTGKALSQPSDDPAHVAQDLDLRNQIALGNDTVTNLANVTGQMTATDGAMSSLVNVLQSARSLAVQGASDTMTPAQQKSIGDQVNQLLDEAIGLANTQYDGQYVFGGTASLGGKPVVATGSPVSGVTFSGNLQAVTQQFVGGQSAQTNVTLQQAFNYGSSDGSPDVFSALINLRNALDGGTITDKSASALNVAGTVIDATAGTGTPLAAPAFAVPAVADASGNVSVSLSSSQNIDGVVLTFNPATATVGDVINAIDGSGTGVTASWSASQQRIVLSGSGAFEIQDISSPGATDTGNLVEALGLTPQADIVNELSGQLSDIDNVTQAAVTTRARVGATVQSLQALSSTQSAQVNANTQVQSGIEDADIAKVMTEYTQTQTALQAAYGTTTQLESKNLFDYLS
jgi:flagellar hook-associated protein 3 FlgL